MPRFARFGLLALLFTLTLAASARAQQVTGLSGWSLFIDPGHSTTSENVGIYGYAEPTKVLRVGLALREMLLTRTDIDTVYMSRTNDTQVVGLSQRSTLANSLGADFFHSIHSNAGAASTNNVLTLYGGWRLNGQTVEKTPQGGGRMGDEYIEALQTAYRLPSLGNYADRTFYQGFPDTHANQYPYLSVNRQSNMASILTEAGFHTNPRQNMLNMNAEWKRMEAQAYYWSILDWHGVPRSVHRIATGIITDAESGTPINGATIEIAGQSYTTDTYDSLFHQYSSNPDELHNGFYYLEELPAGAHTLTVSAPGYETKTAEVTLEETWFTFTDLTLLSTVPPVVTETDPAEGDPSFPVTAPLRLTFSRPLDPATAGPAFSLIPTAGGDPVSGTVSFDNGGYRLVFTPDAPLEARTGFTLTLAGTAATANGSLLDGDGDGTGGDAFMLSFTSSYPDVSAPRLTAAEPAPGARDVDLRPLVAVTFDEAVNSATFDGRVKLYVGLSTTEVSGHFTVDIAGLVGDAPEPRSVVAFTPDAPLAPGTQYLFAIEPGVEDSYGNATTQRLSFLFTTGQTQPLVTVIERFEGTSIADNWWEPAQSGSTTGIVADSTDKSVTSRASLLSGTTAMQIDYGWAEGAGSWLIREYLNGGVPQAVRFDDTYTLRARVFGDGVGTQFRFAVDDGSSDTEVSPWTTVDWYGWRTVSWDLDGGQFGTWIGNGQWDQSPQLRFDSFQLSYDGTSGRFGELIVDDLELTKLGPTAGEETARVDGPLALSPAHPNPFRDRTTLAFTLGAPAEVTVRVFNAIGQEVTVLAERQPLAAGPQTLVWDASGLAAGVYVARVEAGTEVGTVRLVLAR